MPRKKRAMIDQKKLLRIIQKTFENSVEAISVNPLAGDASDRIYYRLNWESNEGPHSCILMAMAHTGAAVPSEEVTTASDAAISELPFLNVQRHLLNCKIAVPEIYFYDPDQGWLLLEDLGHLTFADEIGKHFTNTERLCEYYQKAIDVLISLQLNGTPILREQTIAHTRYYDKSLFEWEFNHFIEFGIEKRKGTPDLSPAHKKELQAYFSSLSAHFDALPKVLTHRDYHSRNLMIQPGEDGINIRVIDFQDALMGPAEYDLASLLRDSYIDLPTQVIDTCLEYYVRQWRIRGGDVIDPVLFRESFDLISFQRNLKAAGRFVYIDQVKHKNHLLPFVTPTLIKARQTLLQYDRLKPLFDLLAASVPEFQSS